jgi:secretion/DNA translocation related TadE-like protein
MTAMTRERGGRSQRGSGTLLVAGALLVVVVIAGIALVLVGYIAAQHGAAGAADLAALSGAAAYVRGDDACAAVRTVARANGANLKSCAVAGDSFDFVVTITVTKQLRAPPGLPATVTASAEAGRLSGG